VTSTLHLAQVNIARMKAPLESPVMSGFVARLDEINALADHSPGFVWRLQTSEGNASLEHLREYVYRSAHVEVLRQRHEWFTRFDAAYLALWWVPAGHRPSVDEAKKRLAHLDAHGPTPFAFTFKVTFPPDPVLVRAIDWSAFEPCPTT
jgi:Zn-dependent oligopeptidase